MLSQCIPQNFSRLPHQRHHPREGGCADQEEKDAVRQRRVGLIPAVDTSGIPSRSRTARLSSKSRRHSPAPSIKTTIATTSLFCLWHISIDRQLLQPSVCQFLKPEVSSLEVRINKEVRDYQESLFFGLTLRQFIFALLAVAVAVGIYFGLRPVLGSEVGWVCILAAFPFALGGFFQYNSMTFEQFILAVIRSELLYPKRLVFKSDHLYAKALDNSTLKEAVKLD